MCDYSLESEMSREARAGDRLTVAKIGKSVSCGFCEPGVPDVAVCLLPGTELEFEAPVALAWPWKLTQLLRRPSHLARFRQIDKDIPNTHHDALELANGQIVKLAFLLEGQRARILQLPIRATGFERFETHHTSDPAIFAS